MKQREYEEQCVFFQWAALNEKKYPALNMLFASANGGKRNIITAMKLKKAGVKAGIPDIFLAWPNKLYHGFFIEMKYGKNTTSEKQKMWITKLENVGYAVAICWSFEEARDKVIDYLNGYSNG